MEGDRQSPFDEVLEQVLEAPRAEQAKVLAGADPTIRRRVLRVLEAEEDLDRFLEPKFETGDSPSAAKAPRRGFFRRAFDTGSQPAEGILRTSDMALAASSLQLAERLRRVGWWAAILLAITGSIHGASLALAGNSFAVVQLELGLIIGVALLSVGLAVTSARARLDDRQLFFLGAVYLLLISALSGAFHAVYECRDFGRVTPFGAHVFWIGFFPLVLPAGVRRTLLLGSAAACSSVLGIALGCPQALGNGLPSAPLLVAPVCGVVLAAILAANLERLRNEMEEVRRLGSYQLREKLGVGGMGEVWRADHHLLARPAAVKFVRPEHLSGGSEKREAMIERFTREARATAALTSAHTVELYDFGLTLDGVFFFAMELLDGIDLDRLVCDFGAQPVGRVLSILRQACDSLGEAHARGMVHRDIKTANLMLCRRGLQVDVLKILDFGIVALAAGPTDAGLTQPGTLLGTPAYQAPEVLEQQPADPRSDIYALGCVAYHLLTGRPVFELDSRVQLIAAHLRDTPTPPSAHASDMPTEVDALVLRCLAKDPADRFQDTSELLAAVDACANLDDWDEGRARRWWKALPS